MEIALQLAVYWLVLCICGASLVTTANKFDRALLIWLFIWPVIVVWYFVGAFQFDWPIPKNISQFWIVFVAISSVVTVVLVMRTRSRRMAAFGAASLAPWPFIFIRLAS